MANILPLETKHDVLRTFYMRMLIVGSMALSFVMLFGCIALVPSYLAIDIIAPAPKNQDFEKNETNRAEIKRMSSLLETVAPIVVAQYSLSETLQGILVQVPDGIVITNIAYVPGEVTLSGAGTRENIRTFRESLLTSNRITDVSVPIGSLVGTERSEFSIRIQGDL